MKYSNLRNKIRWWALGVFLGAILYLLLATYYLLPTTLAATNISPTTTDHWAWSDVLGWIDFYNTDTVNVTAQKMTGYASSSAGDISLDCATTRIGDTCATSNYYVTNDGEGNLAGWGWNDTYGWISFCGGQSSSNCPGTTSYRVLVSVSTGDFTNYAWNDTAGWISFNCSNTASCGTSNYKVNTSWRQAASSGTLISSVFDTGVSGGAQINSIMWRGALPSPANGAGVSFQFAVSNASSGPWNYQGYDGTSNTWYTTTMGSSTDVDYSFHANARYFRYQVKITSNLTQTKSPRLDDISVNWSR